MSDIQTNEDKQKAIEESEDSPAEPAVESTLPLSTNLKLVYIFSLIIAFLTAATAVGSIVFRDKVYPADWIIQSFLPNDIVTLLIGLPILLGSMLLAYRGSLIGLLFWPGALFYGLYNYFIYLLGMPFGVMYVIHMTIVTLSTYTLIGLIASIDGAAVKKRLVGNVPEKLGGGVLFLAGDAFALLALIAIETAEISDHNLPPAELALSTADFIASAAWIIGGVLLWRKKPLGYVAGPGLLFNIAMLFVGLLIVLLLQPLLADVAFSAPDFIVILIMTIISFIPLALFIRGIRKAGATKPVASR